MNIVTDHNIRVERIWCGETTGSKLLVQHVPSGIFVERVIGFDEQSQYIAELQAQLLQQLNALYPPEHFIVEHLWCGPGKGASLRLIHVPTRTTVERFVGYEDKARHISEMMSELFFRLK